MKTGFLPGLSSTPQAARDRTKPDRVAKIPGALIGVLAACALILPAPAGATTSCSTHGLTLHVAGEASLDVVGLSTQGYPCAKAVVVARQVARELAAGSPISVSGAAGIDMASMTPCVGCATQTHVSLGYPSGTINVSLRGATKPASPAATMIPFPALPSPRIPGFPFPNLPSLPTPTSPHSGVATV